MGAEVRAVSSVAVVDDVHTHRGNAVAALVDAVGVAVTEHYLARALHDGEVGKRASVPLVTLSTVSSVADEPQGHDVHSLCACRALRVAVIQGHRHRLPSVRVDARRSAVVVVGIARTALAMHANLPPGRQGAQHSHLAALALRHTYRHRCGRRLVHLRVGCQAVNHGILAGNSLRALCACVSLVTFCSIAHKTCHGLVNQLCCRTCVRCGVRVSVVECDAHGLISLRVHACERRLFLDVFQSVRISAHNLYVPPVGQRAQRHLDCSLALHKVQRYARGVGAECRRINYKAVRHCVLAGIAFQSLFACVAFIPLVVFRHHVAYPVLCPRFYLEQRIHLAAVLLQQVQPVCRSLCLA